MEIDGQDPSTCRLFELAGDLGFIPGNICPAIPAFTTNCNCTAGVATNAPVILETLAPVTAAPVTAAPVTAAPVIAPPVTVAPAGSTDTNAPTGASGTGAPSTAAFAAVGRFITTAISVGGEILQPGTVQNRAFTTLAEISPDLDPSTPDGQREIVQRYALNTLYFQTGGPNWMSSIGWTSAVDPCMWFGVQCADSGEILAITLMSNNLDSANGLPSELSAITSLGKPN